MFRVLVNKAIMCLFKQAPAFIQSDRPGRMVGKSLTWAGFKSMAPEFTRADHSNLTSILDYSTIPSDPAYRYADMSGVPVPCGIKTSGCVDLKVRCIILLISTFIAQKWQGTFNYFDLSSSLDMIFCTYCMLLVRPRVLACYCILGLFLGLSRGGIVLHAFLPCEILVITWLKPFLLFNINVSTFQLFGLERFWRPRIFIRVPCHFSSCHINRSLSISPWMSLCDGRCRLRRWVFSVRAFANYNLGGW